MTAEQQRHDINDKAWEKIRPHTIGEKGTRGGNARDTRQFINGVFWILRTGAPWRDLPETYGNWKNVHRRFCRWRDKGVWEKILEALVDDTDFEWLMIDASHVKVHPDAAGARGGNQAMSRTKGGSTPRYIWPWMRMVCRCDSLSLLVPQRIAQLQHGWLRGSRQNIFWPTAVMIQTRSFFRRWNKTWFLSFPQRKIGNSYVNTTNISTKFDISLRMLSCSSKDGAVLRRATLKILLLSSPPSKSVVLPFGCSFIDDTI